ncbi:MAG: hypothetical protein ACFB15_09720 [Cyclobacteriaceae bacterium]
MKNARLYQPGSFTRWWVITSLLLSLLSFSGYTGWAQTPTERAQQIELVVSDRQRVKRGHLYFSLPSFPQAFPSISFANHEKLAERDFNRLTKLMGNHLRHQYLSIKIFRVFFLYRAVLQNPEEDDKPHLLIG